MRRRAPAVGRETLSAEIADLSNADIRDLRERWKALYGKEPSVHIGRSFLVRAVAYRVQEMAYGGLNPSTRRLLARVAEEIPAVSSPRRPQSRTAQTGTILIRE